MNDKPEMSAEERAKLKAELREEIKEEIKSEFVTTPRELPPTDNEELLKYRDKWSEYHNAETYYRLAREEHIKYEEDGVWEYSERDELNFLIDTEFETDHPYYLWDLRDNPPTEEQLRQQMEDVPWHPIWLLLGIIFYSFLFSLIGC
ncbi:hypothetical protein OAN47_03545 [Planctomycetota bacterium]|nr:hypothetical protein [Planctomycetota bacterium]